MSLVIKNLSKSDWEELLNWARIGANNAMIGEFTEVEELRPHGDLIDRDELKRHGYFFPCAVGSEYAIPLRALREAPTIIQKEE